MPMVDVWGKDHSKAALHPPSLLAVLSERDTVYDRAHKPSTTFLDARETMNIRPML